MNDDFSELWSLAARQFPLGIETLHGPDHWQRVERSTSQNIGVTNSSDMQRWMTAFQHYQTTGDINPALKPEFIITMIFGIISSAALDSNVFLATKRDQNQYMAFCINGLLLMLK